MQPIGGMDANAMMQRLRRLATLDTTVFDEIRGDAASTVPAAIIAVASFFLAGIGGWLWWVIVDIPESGDIFVKSTILGSLFAIGLYAVWVGVVYVMLTQVFRARADMQELARVMGFAAAPFALSVLMFIPVLDVAIAFTALVLLFGANIVAVQSATDAPGGRVMAANGVGFLVWSLILSLLVTDENVYAPGPFVLDAGVEILKTLADLSSIFS
jgi:hypothetical protein